MAEQRTSRTMMARELRQPVPRDPVSRARFYADRLPALARVPWIPLVFLAGASIAFGHYVLSSDYFRVKEWEVSGLQRLSKDEALKLAQLDGDAAPHILRYDAGDAERRISEHPLVHGAVLKRSFPHRLEIAVRERREAMILVTDEGSFLADDEGIAFALAEGTDVLNEELPMVSLHDASTWQPGAKLPEEARDALLLYSETLSRSGTRLAREVAEVHWDDETGIVLTMRGGARLVCGRSMPEETLPRGEALARKLDGFATVDTADLRIESHIPWHPIEVPADEAPRRVAAAR